MPCKMHYLRDIDGSETIVLPSAGTSRKRARVSQSEDEDVNASTVGAGGDGLNVAVSYQPNKQIDGRLLLLNMLGCQSGIESLAVSIRCGSPLVFSSLGKVSLPGGSTMSSRTGFMIFATADSNKLQSEEFPEAEYKSLKKYAWADAKKPRICILGGGFGGLYTALRIESLVWPADKKPEALKSRLFDQQGKHDSRALAIANLLHGQPRP
ncbi:hypothetical protein L7F22_014911 [Adiantum nelumboides]|nr:hypothetical protein [Adiantum nelumboides]